MNNPKVIIVFGQMGAGKNHHGERIARRLGVPFLDGDDVLPLEMKERVRRFGFLPQKMIDEYVLGPLFTAIKQQASQKGIVVAQALYNDMTRKMLEGRLEVWDFTVEFVYVKAPFFRNMRQIASRRRGLLWVVYWLLSRMFFEEPTHIAWPAELYPPRVLDRMASVGRGKQPGTWELMIIKTNDFSFMTSTDEDVEVLSTKVFSSREEADQACKEWWDAIDREPHG